MPSFPLRLCAVILVGLASAGDAEAGPYEPCARCTPHAGRYHRPTMIKGCYPATLPVYGPWYGYHETTWRRMPPQRPCHDGEFSNPYGYEVRPATTRRAPSAEASGTPAPEPAPPGARPPETMRLDDLQPIPARSPVLFAP